MRNKYCSEGHCSGFWNLYCEDPLHPTSNAIGQFASELKSIEINSPELFKEYLIYFKSILNKLNKK